MKRALLLLLAFFVITTAMAHAQDSPLTRVMVRVLARDAKLIGSGVGGAKVTIVDVATGEILAEGLHAGGTGDTEQIMSTPHERSTSIYNAEGTAGFLAELRLSRPTVVNISAIGPLGFPQATRAATKQMLLAPGQDVLGDGVVLELHGFIVEILTPMPLDPVGGAIEVTARVRMMCGCPITPGGMWDADSKTIVAHLLADGRVVADAALRYAGQPNMFSGTLTVPAGAADRDLTVDVVAADRGAQNFGRHEIPLSGER
ncbi:MAG TPA: hypothetical protein VLC48_04730 [Gemmatimonadota bacterium]|nr:hypothetical protein [Gemmatimonadota bacterium]